MHIDLLIVATFLIINLFVGIYYGRGVKTIKKYAIGNRNFSTATIAATIVATWVSGDFFTVAVSDTYKEGLWFAFAGAGDIVALLIIGRVLGPRMKEFFGSLSVAEVMGNLYGTRIRIVTAIASIAHAVGIISLQIKVFSMIFSHFLGLSSIYASLISSFVVIFYATFGGIRAVTFTDVIQFFAFGVFLPMFALFAWQVFGNIELLTTTFATNELFNYRELVNYNNPNFFPYMLLFLYCSIPSFNSTLFQRTLMAKNTRQISQSFTVAGVITLIIHIFACFIGLVVLSHNPNINPDSVAVYVVDNYSFIGLRGLAIIGIMAMVMSTADSWINTASVVFAHDFCKPLGLQFKNELLISRIFAILVGISAVLMTISTLKLSILQLFLLKANFYKPVITVPLILAILGFRSSTKAVSIGMFTGGIWAIIWKVNITPLTGVDSVVPAMLMNLLAYMGSHYLLGEQGGWIGITDNQRSAELRRQRKNRLKAISKFLSHLPQFNLREYCASLLPTNDLIYSYFAFGSLLTLIVTFSLPKGVYYAHTLLINVSQFISLAISTFFICRNLLLSQKLQRKYLGLIWYIAIFTNLALISSFLVLISKFSQISLVIFIINLAMIAMLLNWQTTLMMIIIGTSSAFYSYKLYIGMPIAAELNDLKLKILYTVLTISGFLLAFIKPKQDLQAQREEKISYLDNYIHNTEAELSRSLNFKSEFLRNLEHEVHTPITGITSLSGILLDNYDKLSETQRYQALQTIAKSSERLNSLVENILHLPKLSSLSYQLTPALLNLSELLDERIAKCKKLYLGNKDLEFTTNIEDAVFANCDKLYIRSTFDNLIINAIQYSKEGVINIALTKYDTEIKFTIQDEGIGIPRDELFDIFGAFVVSSKTYTPAGGRGVGLAVCKKAIELHRGYIKAESDGKQGAIFTFIIPMNPF